MNPLLRPFLRILYNPSLMALVFFAITLALAFYFVGDWLLPVMISLVIAYLLEGVIKQLQRRLGLKRIFAVCLVYVAFSALIIYILVALGPILINQAKDMISNLPSYLEYAQQHLNVLPERFPRYVSTSDINSLMASVSNGLSTFTRNLFSLKLFNSLLNLATIAVYIILIPILVFFMLKDKTRILSWMSRFLPENHQIIEDIWTEVDVQIGNYIRGKFIEILIIWMLCFIAFNLFGLQYSLLLGFMVGVSVLVPYIGATAVTLPILIVAYMQFGVSMTFLWVVLVYTVIQLLDGNVIVPLIFSEAVNIHPLAIIIAVLIFGGLWGFWGLFFAIPLATLVKAVIEAWQRYEIRDN